MPIYEYACSRCNHHFDLMQKINEEPARQCPKCYEDSLVKLVSAAGFQLKGSGWYATDFKNKGSAETKKAAEEKPAAEPAKPSAESGKTGTSSTKSETD